MATVTELEILQKLIIQKHKKIGKAKFKIPNLTNKFVGELMNMPQLIPTQDHKDYIRSDSPTELDKSKYVGEHAHDWEEKWGGRYRVCPCGLREWMFNCWTHYRFEPIAPRDLLHNNGYQRILKEGVNDGANYYWSRVPHLIRSMGILSMDKLEEKITIVGVGSIGSFTALCLAKMGFNHVSLFDHDFIKIENAGVQLFGSRKAIENGQTLKTDETARLLENQDIGFGTIHYNTAPPQRIYSYGQKFEAGVQGKEDRRHGVRYNYGGTVISAVDSMASRAEIWQNVKGKKSINWFIDARMGAEFAMLYVIDPNSEKDIATYEKTLYSDDESVKEPCTAKTTIYTALMIAGLIGKAVKDVLMGTPYPRIVHWNIANHSQQIWQGGLPAPETEGAEKKRRKVTTPDQAKTKPDPTVFVTV